MFKPINRDEDIAKLHGFSEEGAIYRNFLSKEKLRGINEVLEEHFCFHTLKPIDGQVGAAFERYYDYSTCLSHGSNVPALEREIMRVSNIFASPPKPWCATLLALEKLGGMTSHKDYSYNRYVLGTLILEGSLIYGAAKTRDEAYNPENLVRAQAGDLIALKAPSEFSQERPYFCMFAPENCTAARIWIREPTTCPHYKRKDDKTN